MTTISAPFGARRCGSALSARCSSTPGRRRRSRGRGFSRSPWSSCCSRSRTQVLSWVGAVGAATAIVGGRLAGVLFLLAFTARVVRPPPPARTPSPRPHRRRVTRPVTPPPARRESAPRRAGPARRPRRRRVTRPVTPPARSARERRFSDRSRARAARRPASAHRARTDRGGGHAPGVDELLRPLASKRKSSCISGLQPWPENGDEPVSTRRTDPGRKTDPGVPGEPKYSWRTAPPGAPTHGYRHRDPRPLGSRATGRSRTAGRARTPALGGAGVAALTHLPLRRRPVPAVNIHGHLHGEDDATGRHANVTVERTGYKPVRLDEVLERVRRPLPTGK